MICFLLLLLCSCLYGSDKDNTPSFITDVTMEKLFKSQQQQEYSLDSQKPETVIMKHAAFSKKNPYVASLKKHSAIAAIMRQQKEIAAACSQHKFHTHEKIKVSKDMHVHFQTSQQSMLQPVRGVQRLQPVRLTAEQEAQFTLTSEQEAKAQKYR